MRKILSIQGGMAGGKTTLAKRLELQHRFRDVFFSYENPYPIVEKSRKKKLDLLTRDGFVENQRLFIEAEIKRFNNLPDCNVIFDRGPEDIEFYTLYFPIANGFDWDIETLLKDELRELRKCRSDVIIYLDANEEVLRIRKRDDQTKKRRSFEKNIKLYPYEKKWYKQYNTKFIDVNHKTPEQVEESVLNLINDIDFLKT